MAADITSVRVILLSRALAGDCKLASSHVYLFFLTIMVIIMIVRPCGAGLNEDSATAILNSFTSLFTMCLKHMDLLSKGTMLMTT